MSQDPPYRHLSEIPMVYPLPDADEVVTRLGVEYARGDSAVFSCAYLADLDGATHVADASRQWKFTYPDGFRVENLPVDRPVFIARAGNEQDPGLNQALDRLVAAMLALNRPVTCVNFAAAPHGFELFHDTLETREVIRQMMRFARFHLAGTAADGVNV